MIDKESEGFPYLRLRFLKVVRPKWKGILIGPQIKQLFEYHNFSTDLNATERRAWEALVNVCRNFLGNEKVENNSEIVQELISSYSAVGWNLLL